MRRGKRPLFSPGPRVERWRRALSSVEPERTYRQVRPDGRSLDQLHNWVVYSSAGECLRQAAGLAPARDFLWGESFFHKYMPAQLGHFTANGMYGDPNDPLTYDITTRLQIATALAFGYDGPLRDDLGELLRRGGLAQLLFVSPDGLAPFGGRSNQFQFQEAILSALCELEARRYKTSDPRLAGAFKRQARRSAQSVRRWLLDMTPFRHVKNGFEPSRGHGNDAYAAYSNYGLLAASFFGLAAIFADDAIAEAPCPAEEGGCVIELRDAFHKVFASCRGTQIEIDTRADFNYDATGLGRFTRAGRRKEGTLPSPYRRAETGKSRPQREASPLFFHGMPVTATPHYVVAEQHKAKENLAIGPAWLAAGSWVRLAALSEGLESELTILRETAAEVAFTVTYFHEPARTRVTEEYALSGGALRIRSSVAIDGRPAGAVRLLAPLLVTDGSIGSRISREAGKVTVAYRGAELAVRFDPSLRTSIDDALAANRNGLYRCLALEAPCGAIAAELALRPR